MKKASGLKAGSSTTGKETAARLTSKQIRDIAESKMKDLNANDIDGAMQIILGFSKINGNRSKGLRIGDIKMGKVGKKFLSAKKAFEDKHDLSLDEAVTW